MHRMAWWLVLWAFSCGPAETSSKEVRTHRQEIIGGSVAYGDEAVVSVATEDAAFCTGTLIAPQTVLTAAHCIDFQDLTPQFVLFGTDVSDPTLAVEVVEAYRHPNYADGIRDFALLRLESEVMGVTPIALNTVPFRTSDIGRSIRHVGFGLSNAATESGSGTKRQVSYPLRSFDKWLLESGGQGKQTCKGDSGGPALMKMGNSPREVVVGVVSWGDADCQSKGVDARVDADLSWILSTMSEWETSLCEADGQCVEVGSSCASDLDCVSGVCINDLQSGNHWYCSQECRNSAECPSGMECGASRLCQFPPQPEKQLGERCALTDSCREGLCTAPANEARRCATECETAASCPVGYTCEWGIDDIRFCRAPGPTQSTSVLPLTPQYPQRSFGCQSGAGDSFGWLVILASGVFLRRKARGPVAGKTSPGL